MSLTKGITLKQAAACALAMAAIVFHVAVAAAAGGNEPAPCTEDAMIVFDASGSMAGNMNQGIATTLPRINEVRKALGRVLPGVTRFRRVGLITYGPGPYQQCNVELNLRPIPDAARRIMHDVNFLIPPARRRCRRPWSKRRRFWTFAPSPASSSCSPMGRRPAAARPTRSARDFMLKAPISPCMSSASR